MGTSRHRRRTTIDRSNALAAAEWILERRAKRDPDGQWRFPDPADLWDVVSFVEHNQDVPDEMLRDDAVALIAILTYLAGEVDRHQMFALRIGRRAGATWPTLAGPMGLTYQGAEQRLLRLESLFDGDDGTRDEAVGRRLRRQPRRPAPRAAPRMEERPPDDAATAELRAALGQLLALEEALPDDLADDLLGLRREATARRAELTAGQLRNALRVVANEMSAGEWPPAVAAAVDRLVAAVG